MLRKIRITAAAVCYMLITLLFLDFTGTLHAWFGFLAKIQFLPALLALNFGVVAALIVLTLLFGRVYCSVICPLGVMQDAVSWIAGKRTKNRFRYSPALSWLRYGVLALFIAAAVAGIGSFVALLAPYSAYGRIVSNLIAPLYLWGNNLLAYLVMKEAASTHILAGTVKDAGMSGLFGYKGTHKVKFVVTDTKGRTSYTNLTVKVTEGGSVGTGPEVKWTNKAGTVSYDFGTRYKITKLSDSEADPEVKITVTSQTGIVGFSVDINSTTLTPEELQGLGLSTHMDLVNPGSFEGPLTNLGFPTGSAVAGKKSLTFDISSFMPMLTVLGPGNSDFKLTVIDASGSVSKTIQLYVP